METENVNENALFKVFKAHSRKVLEEYVETRLGDSADWWSTDEASCTQERRVSREQSSLSPSQSNSVRTVLLCLPQELSLRGEPTVGDIKSHVLLPTKETRGEFRTLDGHRVVFKGSKIFVDGPREKAPVNVWPPWAERSVHILCTEDMKGFRAAGDNITIRILHIDRPLRGGCRSSCTLEGMDIAQVRRYICLLRALPEHDAIFAELDDFTHYINKQYGKPSPATEDGSALKMSRRLIRHCIRTSAKTIMTCSPTFSSLVGDQRKSEGCWMTCCGFKSEVSLQNQVRRHTTQLEQAIEGHILLATRKTLTKLVHRECVEENRKFNAACSTLRSKGISQQDLGMRPEFQCPQTQAINHLTTLQQQKTPLAKLQCFAKTIHLLNTAVEDCLHSHVSRDDLSSFQLTTDDLLDQLIYVLIWANEKGIDDIVSQIEFVRSFHSLNVNTSSLGYNLASFEVAVQWIIAHGINSDITVCQILREQDFLWPRCEATQDSNRFDDQTSLVETYQDILPSRFLVVELSQAQEVGKLGSLTQGLFEPREVPLRDVIHFACSKFTADLFCSISSNGRVRVSTGMHHAVLSRRKFIRVSVGENHIVAVDDFGAAFSWGSNSDGQLGVGKCDVDHCATPVQINVCPSNKSSSRNQIAVDVACGSKHSMLLTIKGHLWTWGRGNCGRLGHGNEKTIHTPQCVLSLHSKEVVAIAAGWSHSLAMTGTEIFSFGCGREGRLGHGTFSDSFVPKEICTAAFRDGDAPLQVAAGYAHSAFLTVQGKVFTFGSGVFGQLGLGQNLLPDDLKDAVRPRNYSLSAHEVTQVPILMNPNSIFTKIRNFFPSADQPQPGAREAESENESFSEKTVQGLVPLEMVETPRRKPFLRKESALEPSRLFLKNGSNGGVCLAPQPVRLLGHEHVLSLDCGKYHTSVTTKRNLVYTWGFDETNGIVLAEPFLVNVAPAIVSAVVCGANVSFACLNQDNVSHSN